MNYENQYNLLIESRRSLARSKTNDGHYELHHIVPRSIGGDDDKGNLVLLTPREHYIAHWMLYKMHGGKMKAKLAYAFFMMSRNNPNQKRDITARQYERAKQAMRDSCTGENHPNFGKKIWTDEQKATISKRQLGKNNSMYGKDPWNKGKKLPPLSEERRRALAEFNRGKPRSEETRRKISEGHMGKKLSEETKAKLREINLGKTLSKETRQKMSETRKGKLQSKIKEDVACPHCEIKGKGNAMYRWHFDRCKELVK